MTLFAVSIFTIAIISGGFSVAYAAEKIVDERTLEIKDNLQQRRVCGLDVADVERVTKTTTTEWDNGHFRSHVTVAKTFSDPDTGETVGTNFVVKSFSGKDEDTFTHWVNNSVFKCKNGEGAQTDQFGFTVQKDGTVIFHGKK